MGQLAADLQAHLKRSRTSFRQGDEQSLLVGRGVIDARSGEGEKDLLDHRVELRRRALRLAVREIAETLAVFPADPDVAAQPRLGRTSTTRSLRGTTWQART